MSDTPITVSPLAGYKVEQFNADGSQISYSDIASDASKTESGHNPDFFESDGKSVEEQQLVGKGANPTADIVTKNVTTIDAVHGEPSPVADGVTTLESVPASLPVNAPVAGPSGATHLVGEEATVVDAVDYTKGVLKPEEDGKAAEVVYGAEAEALTEEKAEVEEAPKAKKRSAKASA